MNSEIRKSVTWLSGFNLLLGVWIIISPFVVGFHQLRPAVWNDVVVGIAIALFAFIRLTSVENQPIWSWFNAVVGLWLVISPFLLGFSHAIAPLLNNILGGFVVWLFALSSALVGSSQRGAPSNPS